MIIKNKKGYVNIVFNESDKNEIRNKTPYGKYLEDLKNFYWGIKFKDLYFEDVEIDFSTRVKVGEKIYTKNRDIEDILEEVENKLLKRKQDNNFEPKINPNKSIKYLDLKKYITIIKF